MKSSTVTDGNTKARPSLRHFIVSNLRITVLAAVILIVLWLALELLFPRVTRGESAEAQATQTQTRELSYPPATAEVLMDRDKWGAVKWTVHPVIDNPGPEVCRYGTVESGDAEISVTPDVDVVFHFVYGKPVAFYQESVPMKIARILDIVRAPEAAKDQLGMKLYDVDSLSAQGYRELLEEIRPERKSDEAAAEWDDSKYANQPIMAFVAALNTGPWMNLSDWHEKDGTSRKIDFIGTPVQWNTDVVALMEYEAGESDLYKVVSECADYSNRKLIKRAMYDVIASAEGINKETPDALRFADIAVSKMYLGVMSRYVALEDEIKGVNPIRTVSFRSAWDEALTQQ